MPCRVLGPLLRQGSSRLTPPLPYAARLPDTRPETPTSKPVAKMTQSTSYSASPTKIEVSVIRVTPPWSAVSTSVTDGSLKASRYVSLNVGRLHMYRYQ